MPSVTGVTNPEKCHTLSDHAKNLLAVLTLASSASAECAWIWWAMAGETADVAGGYTTKQECEQALSTFEAKLKTSPLKVSRILDGNRLMVTSSQNLATIHSCLPDTVDPRGAKGK